MASGGYKPEVWKWGALLWSRLLTAEHAWAVLSSRRRPSSASPPLNELGQKAVTRTLQAHFPHLQNGGLSVSGSPGFLPSGDIMATRHQCLAGQREEEQRASQPLTCKKSVMPWRKAGTPGIATVMVGEAMPGPPAPGPAGPSRFPRS